jgi:hypothetical protein
VLWAAAIVALSCREPRRGKALSHDESAPIQALGSREAVAAGGRLGQLLEADVSAFTLDSSAYHASIALDDEALYVLTKTALHRVGRGGQRSEFALDLGFGAAVAGSFIVFWSQNSVWRVAKGGGTPQRVGPLSERPQYFVTAGNGFAWLARSAEGTFAIRTFDGRGAVTRYASPGRIDAVAMSDEQIFFVERSADDSWRIGAVRGAGGDPAFTEPHRGRAPSMLAVREAVYYYDGNGRELHRLSLDLRRDETLASELVCSPIAVSDRVYCGQVGGIVAWSDMDRRARLLSASGRAPITALAAHASDVAWLSEAGPERVLVNWARQTGAR